MISIRTRRARTEAVDHVEWVHTICHLGSAPRRAVELLERGLTRTEIIDELHIGVHGSPRLSSTAPWRDLFLGRVDLDDPDLNDVEVSG